MADREYNPVANLFPLLEGAAFDELAADIKKNGLRESILIDSEGRIVDGRNRYRACLAAGVEPRFVEWKGQGELAELALSLNLRRRHLNESQRAMVAARLAKLLETPMGRPRKSPANLPDFSRGESRSKAAAQVNVSPRLVSSAIKVLQSGSPGLIAAVESGAIAVSTASALATLSHKGQKRVVAGGMKEVARKVRELRAAKSSTEPKPPPPLPGCFGMVPLGPSGPRPTEAGEESIAFLWVVSSAVSDAVAALKARGLRYAPPAG